MFISEKSIYSTNFLTALEYLRDYMSDVSLLLNNYNGFIRYKHKNEGIVFSINYKYNQLNVKNTLYYYIYDEYKLSFNEIRLLIGIIAKENMNYKIGMNIGAIL